MRIQKTDGLKAVGMKKLAPAGAALALVLAIACGGDGDGEATAVATSTAAPVIESISEPTSAPTLSVPDPTQTPAIAPTLASAPEPTSTTAPLPTSAPATPTATAASAPEPTVAPTATSVPPTSTPPTATSVPPTATPVPPTPVATPSSESLVRAMAIVFGAQEFGVSTSDVKLDSSEPITWPNEALGCVVPGQLYSAGAVEGWLITVSAGSASLEYHSDATGGQIFTCTEAERISSLPSINVVNAASLSGVTSVVISAAQGTVEVVRVDDSERIELVLLALSEPTYLGDSSSCESLFQVAFVTASGSTTFEYACSGQSYVLRGTQSFWAGADGISPAGFQRIINQALADRKFPGFPPTP